MGQARDTTGQHTGRLVSVDEAARALGLSVDAVRKRIQRGTIAHEKDAAGRVRIILDGSETLRDDVRDSAGPNPEVLAARLEGLQDQLEMLREMLAEEREARRRADTVLAQLSQANAEQARTIRSLEQALELPPPQAPREAPQEAPAEQEGAGPRPDAPSPQEAAPQEAAQGPQEAVGPVASDGQPGPATPPPSSQDGGPPEGVEQEERSAPEVLAADRENTEGQPEPAKPKGPEGRPLFATDEPQPRPWWRRMLGR